MRGRPVPAPGETPLRSAKDDATGNYHAGVHEEDEKRGAYIAPSMADTLLPGNSIERRTHVGGQKGCSPAASVKELRINGRRDASQKNLLSALGSVLF